MKFNLQGIDTDLEIELKRSKEFFDWHNEGKPEELKTLIEFTSDSDSCPVGSVEFVEGALGFSPNPLTIPDTTPNEYLGRKRWVFEGNQVPKNIKQEKVFVKSILKIKSLENGWYKPGDMLDSLSTYECFERFRAPILGEYRVFLGRQGQVLDIRNYIGFETWPNVERIKEIASFLFSHYNRPFSFDVVVLESGETYLLELHDYWSLGLYGFSDLQKLPFLIWDWYKTIKR